MTDYSKKELLNQAEAFVSKKEFDKAFDVFSHLQAKDFIEFTTADISIKDIDGIGKKLKGPFHNQCANQYFWKSVACEDVERLAEWVTSDESFSLFKYYFRDTACINHVLLRVLAENHPTHLIKFIRTNEAFFKEAHFQSFAFLEKHTNSYLRLHYRCFVVIRNFTSTYKQSERAIAEGLKQGEFWDDFYRLTLYLERLAFDENDFQILQPAGGVFLQVLKWHISLNGFPALNKNFLEFENKQKEHVKLAKENPEEYFNHPSITAFNYLFHYHFYLENEKQRYCYDLNTEPELTKSGLIEWKYVDLGRQHRWRVNGLLYGAIHERYLQHGMDFYLFQSGNSMESNNSEKDSQLVYMSDMYASLFMLNDLNIKTIPIFNGQQIDSEEMCTYISSIAALGKSIRDIPFVNDWKEHLTLLFEKNPFTQYPVLLMTFNDIVSELKGVKESENRYDAPEGAVRMFTTTIDEEAIRSFKVYSPLEVFHYRPLLQINGVYYALTLMLESNNPFMTLYGAFMDVYEKSRKSVIWEENKALETMLADKIKSLGLDGVSSSRRYFKEPDFTIELGDIDVCFLLNGELVLLELKRTKFKFNDKQRWTEWQGTIKKAADQLNRAEDYLRNNPDFLKDEGILKISTESIPIRKYICTTSPEFRGYIANDCTVISMQELMLTIGETVEPKGIGFVEEVLLDFFKNGKFTDHELISFGES